MMVARRARPTDLTLPEAFSGRKSRTRAPAGVRANTRPAVSELGRHRPGGSAALPTPGMYPDKRARTAPPCVPPPLGGTGRGLPGGRKAGRAPSGGAGCAPGRRTRGGHQRRVASTYTRTGWARKPRPLSSSAPRGRLTGQGLPGGRAARATSAPTTVTAPSGGVGVASFDHTAVSAGLDPRSTRASDSTTPRACASSRLPTGRPGGPGAPGSDHRDASWLPQLAPRASGPVARGRAPAPSRWEQRATGRPVGAAW